MNFAGVKSITIPEGDVKRVAIGGVTVWEKPNPLPYDALVEYVESTGAQYVDTGAVANADTSISMSFDNRIATGTSSDAYFGARLGVSDSAFGVLQYYSYTEQQLQARWDYGSATTTTNRPVDSGAQTLTTNGNSATFSAYGTVSGGTFLASGLTLWIFAINNNGAALAPHRGLRIMSFQIFGGSTIVRDFVPVRVGTVGYLYDRANPTGGPSGNGLYGSETSTPLVAGPDKNGGAA